MLNVENSVYVTRYVANRISCRVFALVLLLGTPG